MTMHRLLNVDQKEVLEPIIRFLLEAVPTNMRIY